jgi:WD40 repeat protein
VFIHFFAFFTSTLKLTSDRRTNTTVTPLNPPSHRKKKALMFSNQSAELSLNAPCKTVAAVRADRVESRFLVGTSVVPTSSESSSNNNFLHVIRYHSDVNDVGIDASLAHPTGPIQQLCASPHDRSLVLTLPENAKNLTLYKIPPPIMEMTNDLVDESEATGADSMGFDSPYHDSGMVSHTESTMSGSSRDLTSSSYTMESRLTLESTTRLLDMVWRGSQLHDEDPSSHSSGSSGGAHIPGDVLTLEESGMVTQWDISLGMAESMHSLSAIGSDEALPPIAIPRVKWDPHHPSCMAVSWGRSLRLMDVRDSQNTTHTVIPRAHRYGVVDVDYNPNKPYVLATCGQEGLLNFWDFRSTQRPLLTARGGHSHYAWRVQYNPFHDQLVLSTGTDAVVNLWRVSTISSAPLLTLEDNPAPSAVGGDNVSVASETSAPNVRVSRQELGDSVYGATWGAADAWLYMTVAYDGKVSLHHVPSKEKYKILL